ncbi:proline--tRNA ligase [Neoehrlichia mikurensis]|uniref:Proline--tRNA ligase n=1 Tax=Neoehrlichia mikurensis TaxID=89586 RepID=A0ABY5F1W7_9RICK|nr:proline--tRNA ligase [Neoehrlichia mikurensis]QXK92040.1 proline--tRNA ligase [Neoehrlichia mikurensis]QXK93196.1 proline--tRNA ligase [Neoehrlichia mikurensis]QXK93733.1 proline--tRNA ligase [Neoehrlichia mikurensis]UTO56883.1 proline--tRNA ligase [Neoehrlichia mikurensis]
MRLSSYYIPTLKEVSSDITAVSHKYSLRAGLIKQVASGIYSWLPLGLKVLQNIENIIRHEIMKIGYLEMLMPSMQPADLWKESGRYNNYGLEMLRIQDRNNRELVFGPTHEEVMTDLARSTLKSYKDLPCYLYQIQWKFRDELRPRYGIMRSREFLMKDAYSFDKDINGAIKSYNNMFKAYIKIFKKMGLTPIAVKANSGAIGGTLSHEFHILANTGESTLYYDKQVLDLINDDNVNINHIKDIYTATDEIHDKKSCNTLSENLKISKGIEVGHIFYLGDRYSSQMNATFYDNNVNNHYIQMGCYGIGISRLIGAIIETNHDDKGIKWPESVAPFKFGLINLCINSNGKHISEHIHQLYENNILYDDTYDSAGIKFARMDLIGLPWQIIIGKSVISDNVVELKNRATGTITKININQITQAFLDKKII